MELAERAPVEAPECPFVQWCLSDAESVGPEGRPPRGFSGRTILVVLTEEQLRELEAQGDPLEVVRAAVERVLGGS